ncbi:riboflavin kinase [Pseudobacillus sp. FSL P4-0506]|uniref:riboflavin kinase n=1 Tax=unclassified Pseudobacillus TaxID=2619284 RepID=UPI0030F78385
MSISTTKNVSSAKNKEKNGEVDKLVSTITGKVVRGNQIGRTIGFPTANLYIGTEPSFLEKGVYGVQVFHNNKQYTGIMNIGTRPTIDSKELKIHYEVHILNFSEMIYDQVLTVNVRFFVRQEMKFDSLDQLMEQIRKDIDFIRKRL